LERLRVKLLRHAVARSPNFHCTHRYTRTHTRMNKMRASMLMAKLGHPVARPLGFHDTHR
jgi:hypothetical protein